MMYKIFSLIFLLLSLSCSTLLAQTDSNKTPDKLFEEGQRLHDQEDFKTAILTFDKCLAAAPNHREAYLARASSKEQLRDYAGALTDYSIAVELLPESYEARMGRANVLFRLGRYQDAKADYTALLSLQPGETNTVFFQKAASSSGTMQITTAQSNFQHVVFNYLGMTEYKLGNFDSARKWLDRAITSRPDEADYYANRGLIRFAAKDATFKNDLEHALKLDPDHTVALTTLSTAASDAEADAFLDRAIASDSTKVYPFLERAYQRMQRGHYTQALSDYNYALKLDNKDPETWLNRGFVREKLGDFNGAYADYSKALSLNESYPEAFLNRGNVSLKLNKPDDAVEDYTAAIALSPDYGSAFYNRAVVYERLRKKNEACNDLNRAGALGVKTDPKLKEAVCN